MEGMISQVIGGCGCLGRGSGGAGGIENHDAQIGPTAEGEIDREDGHASTVRLSGRDRAIGRRKESGSCGRQLKQMPNRDLASETAGIASRP